MLKNTAHDNGCTMTHAMAHNVAAWHDASLRPYGVPTHTGELIWWRHPGGSGIYLGASILDDRGDGAGESSRTSEQLRTELDDVKTAWAGQAFGLYDCWASRNLAPWGFVKVVQNSWYLRPPGPLMQVAPPNELAIEVVTTADQLALFEEASRVGFDDLESPNPNWEAFSQHHPATLNNPEMAYLIGKVDGRVVSGVIVHATQNMLAIYGLSTLVQFRRRGYAAALVHASVALHPELPASVFPDPPSVSMYTRIGFAPAGEIAIWKKEPQISADGRN